MCTAVGLALALAVIARAAPGDLDPTFGLGGRAVFSPAVQSVANAAALQSDGKIVLAGWADDLAPPPPPPSGPDGVPERNPDFLTARLTSDGKLGTMRLAPAVMAGSAIGSRPLTRASRT